MPGSKYSLLFPASFPTDKSQSEMYRPNDMIVNGRRTSNIFNTPDKSFHSTYSAPIRGFWSNTQILHLEPLVDETISLFVHQIEERFADGKICMMDNWLEYLSWDFAANTAFGKHHGFLEEGRDVKDMISVSEQGLKYFAVVSQIPWLDEWLDKNPIFRVGPRPLVDAYLAGMMIYQSYLQDIANGTATKGSQLHLMDKYTCLKDTKRIATDDQIMTWLMFNIAAGGDSTAGAMRSVIYHVAKHPSVYKKLRTELDGAVTSVPAQYKQIRDLPYLSAVIQESLRFTAPVGLMLERVVPSTGLTLPDGRFIPSGVKIGINPAVVTRDVGVFGEDADTFRPERWLKREEEDEEGFQKRYRRMFEVTDFVFGTGSRVCTGKHLVRMVLWKTFASLYKGFDVSSPCHYFVPKAFVLVLMTVGQARRPRA